MKNKNLLKGKVIVIAIHEFTEYGGPGQDLLKYVIDNNAKIIRYISHPLFSIHGYQNHTSLCKIFIDGKQIKSKKAVRLYSSEAIQYIKDFFYTLYWVLVSFKRCDVFIGYGPLNAFCGIILKKIGFAKKVVYYSIDYFPVRFKNKLLNTLYHKIDVISVRLSDETWNVGSRMKQARYENGLAGEQYDRQFYVPIGIWYSSTKYIPKSSATFILMYVGHLTEYMGVDLLLSAAKVLIKKYKNIKVEIIGIGNAENELKKMVSRLQIKKYVSFLPWIGKRKDFEKELSKGSIGFALFNSSILDDKVRNADPGKIKDYMLLGMPVITTRELINWKDLVKAKAGIVISYNVKELISAIDMLLQNPAKLEEYRKNAKNYIKKFDWNIILDAQFKRLLNI